jgi:hypothetical protein
LVVVVTHKDGIEGKHYRIATEDDMQVFTSAEAYLAKKQARLLV